MTWPPRPLNAQVARLSGRELRTLLKNRRLMMAGPLAVEWADDDRTTIRAGPVRMHKGPEVVRQDARQLTDLLLRLAGTGETSRDTGDAYRGLRLVSGTSRNAGDARSAATRGISFIPGAHPGYITLEQYDANCARLTVSAAAHGRDRRSGPPREGTALLQGIIICGRCGLRMTVRYHRRGRSQSREVHTYMCQHDGIENGRQACAAIPGEGLDRAIGQLLIDTLTLLTAEAALTVQAELEHRAEEADAPRAAHVERARYHADLARRRYLAVDPASRLVAGTLEAGWNTALRALSQAQEAYDQARKKSTGQLTGTQKTRLRQLATDLPAIWNDPATPMRERKRIARLLLTDVTVTRTTDLRVARHPS